MKIDDFISMLLFSLFHIGKNLLDIKLELLAELFSDVLNFLNT